MKKHTILRETTVWSGEAQPNNIYVFTSTTGRTGECIAYVKAGSNKVERLKKPLTIDFRNRTFETVE